MKNIQKTKCASDKKQEGNHMADYSKMKPGEVRELIRKGEITIPTAGMSLSFKKDWGRSDVESVVIR